jgi:hypothetical protein
MAMNVLFRRQSEAGMQETEGGFRTQLFTDNTDIDFAALRSDLDGEVERFTNVGSGWSVTAILRFVIRVGQYRPLVGSSFIPRPPSLVPKQALVTVHNSSDQICFAWVVLSALHPCKLHTERISKYRPHLNSIDLSGIQFPTPVHQTSRFEKNNPTVSINMYALGDDKKEFILKHVTKCGEGINILICFFSASQLENR